MTQPKTSVKREIERERGHFINNSKHFECDEVELNNDPEYQSLIKISEELKVKI